MQNGIVTLVFGAEYDELAARCFLYSRKYTSLPFLVVSNLETRSSVWDNVSNVKFKYLNWSQDQNRKAKTSIWEYTDFRKSIFIDADCIIQNYGAEDIFKLIPDDGMLFNLYAHWKKPRDVRRSRYKEHFATLGTTAPIEIYYSACFGFDKTESTKLFFEKWNENWVKTGSGRDMPSFAAAAKHIEVKRQVLTSSNIFFTVYPGDNHIIQHEYEGLVKNKVGYSNFKPYRHYRTKAQKKRMMALPIYDKLWQRILRMLNIISRTRKSEK